MGKLISFWKQVRAKSSDMFTLFRVGIGVKVPDNILHVRSIKDPVKIEGLQKDVLEGNKILTLDSNNIVKYAESEDLSTQELLIKILPSDFRGGSTYGSDLIYDRGVGYLAVNRLNVSDLLFVFVPIPDLYKVTHVRVFTTVAVSNGVTVRAFNYKTGGISAVPASVFDTNSIVAITPISAGVTQDMVIEVTPGALTTFIFGAEVTLELI